jgi:branched-chain amino acid transport system substrate-binding protein
MRIGCALSLSGPSAMTGGFYRKAYDLAVEWINSRGGMEVGGRMVKLQVIYYDDQSLPSLAARLTERLVAQDGVRALLGPCSGTLVAAVEGLPDRLGVPMIQSASAVSSLFDRGRRFLFGLRAPAGATFLPLLDVVKVLSPRPTALAAVVREDRQHRDAVRGFSQAASQAGFGATAVLEVESGQRDFAPQIAQLQRDPPQVLILALGLEEAAAFVQQARDRNLNPALVCLAEGISRRELRASLGPMAEYLWGVTGWESSGDYRGKTFGSSGEFARLFREKHGEEPGELGGGAAAAVAVLAAAVEKAGSTEPAAVRDALADLDVPTFLGTVSFDPRGQRREGTSLAQIQGGEPRRVRPEGGRRPLYPMPTWTERYRNNGSQPPPF